MLADELGRAVVAQDVAALHRLALTGLQPYGGRLMEGFRRAP